MSPARPTTPTDDVLHDHPVVEDETPATDTGDTTDIVDGRYRRFARRVVAAAGAAHREHVPF
jgi:hypothetical protein